MSARTRATEVADALVQVDAREFISAGEEVAEEAISTLQQAINQLTALQQVFIEAYARRREREWEVARSAETEAGWSPFGFWTADDFIPSMLAPLLHLSPRTMSSRVDDARRLVTHLPQTLDTALAGDAEPWRVSAVVSASELVSSARVADFGGRVSQARADTFLDLLLAQVQVSTTVVVTVSDESFDAQGLAADSGLAGTLVGDEVSRLLADPAVRVRMARLHAATGATAYLSQESYRPGKELDRLVRERDGTCRFRHPQSPLPLPATSRLQAPCRVASRPRVGRHAHVDESDGP